MGLQEPETKDVDGAYISAERWVEAAAEGVRLLGPAAHSPRNNKGRFTAEDFRVEVEQRRAVCPAGNENTPCSRLEEEPSGKVSFCFEWSQHGHGCPLRERCVADGQKHRTLVVGEHSTALQNRRAEQKTEAFAQEMKRRNAIEGRQSQLVRAHGLRRAPFRGLKQVRLQNYFAGAACNAKRWIRRTLWEMKQSMKAAKVSVETG